MPKRPAHSDADLVRRIVQFAADGLVVHDHQGRFLLANDTACRMLGYGRDELLRLSLGDLEPDFDLFGIREHWNRMVLGQGVTVEGHPRRPDGTAVSVEVRLSLIDDTPGQRRYLAIVRDLKERETTLDALRESQRRFRQLVEHAGDGFFLHDREGRILDVNRRAADSLGSTREALLELRVTDLVRAPGPQAMVAAWAEMAPGQVRSFEAEVRRADGTEFPAEVSVSAVDWHGQRLFIAFARDVTETRRAQRELRRHARELARSNTELQQFAWVASHDLQEPLNKILTFGELLAEDLGPAVPEEARQYLEIMVGAAARMRRLIEDLLAYARLSIEPPDRVEVDLGAVLREVEDVLSLRIAEAGATVEVGPLPRLQGDPVQIGQLFQNLVGNALKYHHADRPPHVRIDGAVEGEEAVVRVEDHGIGFDPEQAEAIFEPFKRLHGRSSYSGTGIGLAICRRIVERHGGTIRATGRPGEGATFEVRLPLRESGGLSPPESPR